jgi:hypothetical protein
MLLLSNELNFIKFHLHFLWNILEFRDLFILNVA